MEGDGTMDFRIEKKENIALIGYQKTINRIDYKENYQEISACWVALTEEKVEQLLTVAAEKTAGFYGVSDSNQPQLSVFNYMIGVKRHEAKDALKILTSIHLPESSWAVYTCEGAIAQAVSTSDTDQLNNLMKRKNQLKAPWQFEAMQENRALPRIEYYPLGDMMSNAYVCELWIPIKEG
ncbi:hypothetical protein RV18_GL003917 [Enterococcus termitis]|nr:hypothetical protein RV18_GL003917 [Enterococcus termitis]